MTLQVRHDHSVVQFVNPAMAPIAERSAHEIDFLVDDVVPCQQRLPVQKARKQLTQNIGSPLLAFSHDDAFPLVKTTGNHPLPYLQHPVTHAPTVRNPILNTPRPEITLPFF
jgi:hypothetical protein